MTPVPPALPLPAQEVDAELELKSLAYLSALVGFAGSIPPALITALFAFADGDWVSGLAAVLFAPFITGLIFAVYALLGYPIYRRLLRAKGERRRLRGSFRPVVADVANAVDAA